MEQHPIPQQINSYEFKLVGEMTLKQFLKAAAGIVLALIINASKLIFFIKWPLMFVFGVGGLALAFVPFQDRPLEQWLSAFIRAIYSPTIYIYKKRPTKDWVDFVGSDKEENKNEEEENKEEEEIPVKNQSKVKEFIESLPSVKFQNQEATEEVVNNELFVNKQVNASTIKEVTTETDKEETVELATDWRESKPNLNLKTEKDVATAEATFGEIPMPDKPDTPNVVVGMVLTNEGKIVEGAIVEMQDMNGNPSRVLKTNQLGQFRTTTPLVNGSYLIITEKEGYQFDKVNIEIVGKIIDPVVIKSH